MENNNVSIKIGSDINLSIEPFMSSGYIFNKMKLDESIGGSIASGSVSFTVSNDKSLITDINEVEINMSKINGGSSYNIKGFIVSKNYLGNDITLNFLCCPREFISEARVFRYTDVSDAIDTLYTWNKNISVESDINNDLEIHQNGQSDYELCKKLAQAYKYNVIFAFGLEGFMIKEVDQEVTDETPRVNYMSDNIQRSQFNFNYYKQFIITPSISDETEYLTMESNDQSSYIVNKDYKQLMENYLYNNRYVNTRLHTDFSTKYIGSYPNYKLGDLVIYNNKDNIPYTKFIMSRFIVDINNSSINCDIFFRGIEQSYKI